MALAKPVPQNPKQELASVTTPHLPPMSSVPLTSVAAASVRKPDHGAVVAARARRLRALDGIVASLALHLAIAFVLAVRLMSVPVSTGGHISSGFGDAIAAGEIDLERITSLEIEPVESSAAAVPEMPVYTPSSEGVSTEELALQQPSLTDGEEFRAAVERAASGSGGSGSGIGGDAGEVAFFGSGSPGTSFVFVVDLSGSMVEQDRFGRMVRELSSTILSMGTEQKFSVVFFNDHAVPLFAPRASSGLIAASKANKQKAVRWIRTRKPDGLTNPEMALEMALEMRPSAIYFLTDGEFNRPERLQERLVRWNPARIPIHTLTFGNRAGEEPMRAIAEASGGSYRFVP